jgi:hypothetical protein
MALTQRGASAEHRLNLTPVEGGEHPQHFGDQQILLKDRGIQVTQAALIGFFDGATLGG